MRSVGRGLVGATPAPITVLVAPSPDTAVPDAGKVVVFGALPTVFAALFEAQPGVAPTPEWSAAAPAGPNQPSESPARIVYGASAAALGGRPWQRVLRRYDFADEWNTLGFGTITADGSHWSLGPSLLLGHGELARIELAGDRVASYAGLLDRPGQSILWFNRPVGPLDSFEWRLVENFLSAHRADELPVVPVLSEIPDGHDAVITMRLDCDEDVESARPLAEAYAARGVPFSLAIHTSMLDATGQPLIGEVLASGGAILSHTATHAPWWGGSYDAARREGRDSADALAAVTGQRPRHAVSPFHQTSGFAAVALADEGYAGCIGGNVQADPEFVAARGGRFPSTPGDFVVHTQQCMLHGDCLATDDDPIAPFRAAFDLAYESASLFGYLDHPFSARYQYGWIDEPSRVAAHLALIEHIRQRASQPLFLNEDAALDFLSRKARTVISPTANGFGVTLPPPADGAPRLVAEFRGERIALHDGMELR